MQKTIKFNSFYIAMQKLLNFIAFYIIIGEIYQDYLKQHGVDEEQIIAINFEDLDYEELTEYK